MDPNSSFIWFVDFDGVNCTTRANMALGRHDDPVAFGLLGRILHDTDALMVVSSTRRGRADLSAPNSCLDMIKRHGLLDRLHPDWCTGQLNSRSREIEDWLDSNGRRPYGILDDERCDFTPEQLQRLIHTDMEFGLGARDVGRARRPARASVGGNPSFDQSLDGAYQAPRITIANQAKEALAALDQGDEDTVRRLLDLIAGNPLSA